ncbi:hypothetical protein QX776_03810 [Alteromonadaceae bacterium BrNp21-10]|nr:hypothetical protein [Alteromonadaceae bacterium BrNp21-10]
MTNTLFASEMMMKNTARLFGLVRRIFEGWSEFIIVILAVIAYWAYGDFQHSNRLELINEPKINDFYFVDYHLIEPTSDERFRYLPLKISSIDNELITFKLGNVRHNMPSAISEHVKFDAAMNRNFFKSKDLVASRQTVINWADEGIIYDIARPDNIYINGWIVMHRNDLQKNH